ncbi:unnamed protein product, partial [Closterium sp. Naga37s-1]
VSFKLTSALTSARLAMGCRHPGSRWRRQCCAGGCASADTGSYVCVFVPYPSPKPCLSPQRCPHLSPHRRRASPHLCHNYLITKTDEDSGRSRRIHTGGHV